MAQKKSKTSRLRFAAYAGILLVVLGLVAVNYVKANEGGAIRISFEGALVDVVRELEQIKEIIGLTGPQEEVSLGAQPGPDSFNNVECHNGICKGFIRNQFTATSSVACILPSPHDGTSTIDRLSFAITQNGFPQAQVIYVSTTTKLRQEFGSTIDGTNTGTSSPAFINARVLAASSQSYFTWEPQTFGTTSIFADEFVTVGELYAHDTISTTGGVQPTMLLSPDEAITFVLATDTPGVFGSYLTGTCSLESTQL